ncbi:MAG: EAL domain-containing protein, partial [Methylococcaceae bacterium]|nr:EAL domain-containing protein [Methylococcaceae bacterium]
AAATNALVGAKEEGRGHFKFYSVEMSRGATARLGLETALRRALERDELVLHYQPRVDLHTGGICAAEALLRWRRDGKLVPPGLFISLAEDTGLILPIGEWVLFEVCRQQREWLDRHLGIVTIAVNISERQLHVLDTRTALPSICRQYLEAMALPAQRLELEVTESLLMQNAEKSIPMLTELHRMGVKLAVDDFGTGYSSLAYLKRLPINYLKIDRSFVMNVTTDPDDASIAFAIINLAHNLRLTVIAEGIETEGQLEYLRRHGCDQMQGFYFSRPLPADEFAELLGSGRALAIPMDDFTPTVLLLDDEESVLDSLKRLLQRDGYRILTTTDPDDALELLAKNTVQVLVADPSMAKIGGIDFLSRVKELHPDCIRIVLSGHTELQRITFAINRGAIWRFLSKPWDDDALREEIRNAFHEHEKHRAG